jgi:hypothetical protein
MVKILRLVPGGYGWSPTQRSVFAKEGHLTISFYV